MVSQSGVRMIELYWRLLRLLPRPFGDEFAGEMMADFTCLVADCQAEPNPIARRLLMGALFLKELVDFPAVHWQARRFRSSISPTTGEALPEPVQITSQDSDQDRRPAPWLDTFLAVLPFVLYGGLNFLIYNHMTQVSLSRILIIGNFAFMAAVELIVGIGLVVGWARGFPRWSYAYLGMMCHFSFFLSSFTVDNRPYRLYAWAPVAIAALVALVVTRSLRPLARFFQGIWQDWSLLSLTLYAFAIPILSIIDFDGRYGWRELGGLLVLTVIISGGVIGYMRLHTSLARVAALDTAVIMIFIWGWTVNNWDFPSANPRDLRSLFLASTLFLGWFSYVFWPLLIGGLNRFVSAFSRR